MVELQQIQRGVSLILMAICLRVVSEPNFQEFHTQMLENATVNNLQAYQHQLSMLLQEVELRINFMQNSTNISNSVEVFINTTTTADNLTTEEPTEKENITLVGHTVEKRDVNSTTQEGSTGESSTQATQAITRQENNGDKPKSLLSTHFSDVMTIIANETDLTERQNVSDASLIIAQVFPEILPTEDSTVVTTAPKLEKTLKIPADQLKLLQSVQNSFNATKCLQLTQDELVRELKDRGTFNPDFMAWDVRGVLHFLEKMSGKYEIEPKSKDGKDMTLSRNVEALEQLLKELNLQGCNANSPEFVNKLYNFTRDITDSTKRYGRLRTRRESEEPLASRSRLKYLYQLYSKPSRDDSSQLSHEHHDPNSPDMIGTVHYVPFGCKKRGTSEDGYLRMCGSCQAIRRMPDNFFPPFINEVACDEDKACLYFYDYPHGKCKQKHMSFVVLKNIGTPDCQIWRKFNINIRVCCECFVDENSFFAKYV